MDCGGQLQIVQLALNETLKVEMLTLLAIWDNEKLGVGGILLDERVTELRTNLI